MANTVNTCIELGRNAIDWELGPRFSRRSSYVRKSIEAAERLMELGMYPFVPLLFHLWDLMSPKPYMYWMRIDLAWVGKCDALLRLPGESRGADLEVIQAIKLGVPVFSSVEELVEWKGRQ